MPTAASVVASLVLHVSAAAFGAIISAHVAISPSALPQGDALQVELVALPDADSDALPDPPRNKGGPDSPPGGAEKQALQKRPATPGSAKQKKTAEAAKGEGKRLAEHAPQGGAANNEEGAHGAARHVSEATPLGSRVNPHPAYPEPARQRGQEGKTLLLVDVDIQGNPAEIRILESSGHPLLDKAAIAAVRRWKFIPARRGDVFIPGQAILPVEFRLR